MAVMGGPRRANACIRNPMRASTQGNHLRGDSVSARRLGPATILGRLSPSQRTRREQLVDVLKSYREHYGAV